MKINVGDVAPDFVALSSDGSKVSLKDFENKNVVLYFYPKDDTPGCTIEAKDFSMLLDSFHELNTVILGVSRDGCKSHVAFKEKYNISFILISDESMEIAEKYGICEEKSMFGKKYMGVNRTTFLISKDKKIIRVWNNVNVDGHAKEVLSAVESML